MKTRNIVPFILLAVVALSLGQDSARAAISSGTIELVSVAHDGRQANGPSWETAISADGRFVAFGSHASNLVRGDTNNQEDIFVHDRLTGTTERVNVASDGTQANDDLIADQGFSISGDGRFVAFNAMSPLTPGDTIGMDVFVRDREAGITKLVSVSRNGTYGNAGSDHSSISANGRFVVFMSHASNLVVNDYNGKTDIFIRDLQTDTTERVIIIGDPEPYPSPYSVGPPVVAPNGLFVAFANMWGPSLFGLFLRDRTAGMTEQIQVTCPPDLACVTITIPRSISDDGRYIIFYHSYNGSIYVHDRQTGITENIISQVGGVNDTSVSSSKDMRFVVFQSNSNNLVSGDINGFPDVFVHDRKTKSTLLVSMANNGRQGNSNSGDPSISADGRFVAFASFASNLVRGDTNGEFDIFVKDLGIENTYSINYLPFMPR